MGTRGAMVFVVDGETKVMYNHFDSYPDGLGLDIMAWLRECLESESRLEEVVSLTRRLRKIEHSDSLPTEEEWHHFSEYADTRVSTGDDWYALLRGTQGKPDVALRAGFYVDASEFLLDSLFCEWAYVVDFDKSVFEIYRGFQTSGKTHGRWVQGGAQERRVLDKTYYPISLMVEIPFSDLRNSDYTSHSIMGLVQALCLPDFRYFL